ncbi:LD-carboxypeptidase [Thermodesulfobacteriota bacterium]
MRKKLLFPSRLKAGDTIGIAAPASHFKKEPFKRGLAVLASMGFNVSVPDNLFVKEGFFAGSDQHRAELLNRLFADRDIDAIICARGGFGSIRILPFLNFDAIRNNPKPFVGFSDITALLSAFYLKCGLITFHGPTVTTLGDATRKAKNALKATLSTDNQLLITPKKVTIIRPGTASGVVFGGNLTTLCHLLGTPFESRFKGQLLFLEDRGEAPYRIDRMLTQMKLAGCFGGLEGLILGSFKDCGRSSEIFGIVKDIFKDDEIPILAGFEVGHMQSNITIPVGLSATLNTDRQELVFHKPSTSDKPGT